MANMTYHHLLMSNHMMLQKELYASLKDTGLSMGQPKVLDYLSDHDGSSQKDIASGCHIEPASLSCVLTRMEKQGLVSRQMQDGNRRSLYVYLTDTGKEFARQVTGSFETLEAQVFQGISATEQEQFMATFLKIYENISKKE